VRRVLLAAAAVTLVGLAACAGSDGPEGGGPPSRGGGFRERGPEGDPGEGRGRLGGEQVFISPMGEPFRAPYAAPYPSAAWFAGADADHDGALSEAEFTADALRFFKVLDANGDGVIDGFEVQAYERVIAPEINPSIGRLRAGEGQDQRLFKPGGGGRGGGRGGRGGGGLGGGDRQAQSSHTQAGDRLSQGAGLYGFLDEPEPVTSADANFDGRITPAEWVAKARRSFHTLDAKGTGRLTLAALPKTPIQTVIEARKARAAKRAAEGKPPSP
jgi:hypothetical protein